MCTKCITHFDKLVYILCTEFSCYRSFNLVYKQDVYTQKFVEMWDTHTFCIHFLYISCIHLVEFLYTQCICNFCLGPQFGENFKKLRKKQLNHVEFIEMR